MSEIFIATGVWACAVWLARISDILNKICSALERQQEDK